MEINAIRLKEIDEYLCSNAARKQKIQNNTKDSSENVLNQEFFFDGKILWHNTDKEQVAVANFKVTILAEVEKIKEVTDAYGEEDDEEVETEWEVSVCTSNQTYITSVMTCEFFSSKWIAEATKARGYINPGKDAREGFEWYLHTLVLAENFPKKKRYRGCGWKEVETDRWNYVLSDGSIGVSNIMASADANLKLPIHKVTGNMAGIFGEFMQMRYVLSGNLSNAVFIQNYTLLATITSIMKKIKCPVKFATALIGKTNTYKTTTAKLFTSIFTGSCKLNFSSTKVALFESMEKCGDSVVLFDDIVPVKDAFSDKEQAE